MQDKLITKLANRDIFAEKEEYASVKEICDEIFENLIKLIEDKKESFEYVAVPIMGKDLLKFQTSWWFKEVDTLLNDKEYYEKARNYRVCCEELDSANCPIATITNAKCIPTIYNKDNTDISLIEKYLESYYGLSLGLNQNMYVNHIDFKLDTIISLLKSFPLGKKLFSVNKYYDGVEVITLSRDQIIEDTTKRFLSDNYTKVLVINLTEFISKAHETKIYKESSPLNHANTILGKLRRLISVG